MGDFCRSYLSYKQTNSFSRLVTDYLDQNPLLRPFYRYSPDWSGLEQALAERKKFPVNRSLLVKTLNAQYADEQLFPETRQNLSSLESDRTFTVCTAHQPNLLTGYLYFTYKILHTIKLSRELKARFSAFDFVPVYYMGSEDNDLEELGVFHYHHSMFRWHADGQKGAVGRMKTESLKPLLDSLFRQMGPPGVNRDELEEILTRAYLNRGHISGATRTLVHELFGKYGLIILDADDPELKSDFRHVIEDDLLYHTPKRLLQEPLAQLATHYPIQAQPREINSFYLRDQFRERIERVSDDSWATIDSTFQWTGIELRDELKTHSERFSPNVILRGLYQETILPNIAFIGGGSEVAYWMQLSSLFEQYHIFFPVILLRQSATLITAENGTRRQRLDLEGIDLFASDQELTRKLLYQEGVGEQFFRDETDQICRIFQKIKSKAFSVDATLEASVEAAWAKTHRQLLRLEKKVFRAEKRKHQVKLRRLQNLKTSLFPDGKLQERHENFLPYYLLWGRNFFDEFLDAAKPLGNEFLILERK